MDQDADPMMRMRVREREEEPVEEDNMPGFNRRVPRAAFDRNQRNMRMDAREMLRADQEFMICEMCLTKVRAMNFLEHIDLCESAKSSDINLKAKVYHQFMSSKYYLHRQLYNARRDYEEQHYKVVVDDDAIGCLNCTFCPTFEDHMAKKCFVRITKDAFVFECKAKAKLALSHYEQYLKTIEVIGYEKIVNEHTAYFKDLENVMTSGTCDSMEDETNRDFLFYDFRFKKIDEQTKEKDEFVRQSKLEHGHLLRQKYAEVKRDVLKWMFRLRCNIEYCRPYNVKSLLRMVRLEHCEPGSSEKPFCLPGEEHIDEPNQRLRDELNHRMRDYVANNGDRRRRHLRLAQADLEQLWNRHFEGLEGLDDAVPAAIDIPIDNFRLFDQDDDAPPEERDAERDRVADLQFARVLRQNFGEQN